MSSESTSSTALRVHRCRFLKWQPQAIVALAWRPDGKQLAVAREKGSIEIWVPITESWHLELTLSGGHVYDVSSLTWARNTFVDEDTDLSDADPLGVQRYPYRLFSGDRAGAIWEWDVQRPGRYWRQESNGGAIWEICASPDGALLACTCEDGSVHVLEPQPVPGVASRSAHTLTLRHVVRVVQRKHALCVAWGRMRSTKRKRSAREEAGASEVSEQRELWVGGADGRIHAVRIPNCEVVRTLELPSMGRASLPLVWRVLYLADEHAEQQHGAAGKRAPDWDSTESGVVVTVDSAGGTAFWSARTGTQLERFCKHPADVLSLAACPQSSERAPWSVFSSGIGGKVAHFTVVAPTGDAGDSAARAPLDSLRWVYTTSQRVHTHDVLSLAARPAASGGDTAHEALLVSGSVDARLGLYAPWRHFQLSSQEASAAAPSSSLQRASHSQLVATLGSCPRLLLPYPHTPPIDLCSRSRLLVASTNEQLELWRLGEAESASGEHGSSSSPPVSTSPEKLVSVQYKSLPPPTHVAVNEQGVVVLLRPARLSVYHFVDGEAAQWRKVRLPSEVRHLTGSAAIFCGAERNILAFASSRRPTLYFMELLPASAVAAKPRMTLLGSLPLRGLALRLASRGKCLAAAFADHSISLIDVKLMRDACKVLCWAPGPVSGLAFTPQSEQLCVCSLPSSAGQGQAAGPAMQFWEVESGRLTTWSRTLAKQMPDSLRKHRSPVLGVSFNPAREHAFVAFSHFATWTGDLDQSPSAGAQSRRQGGKQKRKGKRKANDDRQQQDQRTEAPNPKHCLEYQPLLFAGFLAADEVVTIERPWLHISAALPP
eukprot:CAMPEP_0174229428 /NCGR_PEP_ID=MMETSP0417-20130205/413_1 /TAXON_ID=242541 /ORGANISM="Mayorella sp, Strain BSH-02190019" /LENGTH=828 /DNA_ID=CAMNT_0015306975 /DNA_START=121 /DNA_END=2603 /DNA_ORIENTATION=+